MGQMTHGLVTLDARSLARLAMRGEVVCGDLVIALEPEAIGDALRMLSDPTWDDGSAEQRSTDEGGVQV